MQKRTVLVLFRPCFWDARRLFSGEEYVIPEEFVEVVKKYMNVRPKETKLNRFFLIQKGIVKESSNQKTLDRLNSFVFKFRKYKNLHGSLVSAYVCHYFR